MKKIGFATYRQSPTLTADDLLAAEELRLLGFEVVPVVWDDPATHDSCLAAVVTRSCWDYHLWPEKLRSWLDELDRSGTPVLNSSAVIRWNMDKGYLRDLAAKGVSVPRTVWVEAGCGADLEALLQEHGIEEAVVKPAISLSAHETWRTSLAAARGHQGAFERLVSKGGVLVQALVREVVSRRDLLCFLRRRVQPCGAQAAEERRLSGPGGFRRLARDLPPPCGAGGAGACHRRAGRGAPGLRPGGRDRCR